MNDYDFEVSLNNGVECTRNLAPYILSWHQQEAVAPRRGFNDIADQAADELIRIAKKYSTGQVYARWITNEDADMDLGYHPCLEFSIGKPKYTRFAAKEQKICRIEEFSGLKTWDDKRRYLIPIILKQISISPTLRDEPKFLEKVWETISRISRTEPSP